MPKNVNNLIKLFENRGPSGSWSDRTVEHYGSGVSRLLAACLEKLDLKNEEQILKLFANPTGDNRQVSSHIRSWLGLD